MVAEDTVTATYTKDAMEGRPGTQTAEYAEHAEGREDLVA